MLVQTGSDNIRRVISYASRSLTPVERRYSQIDREGLACLYGLEKFHRYIYGAKTIDLITDHKPLLSIFGNARAKLTARLERFAMRMMTYNFRMVWSCGSTSPIDYCSRHPVPPTKSGDRSTLLTEQYVNFIIDTATPKAISLDSIKRETTNDETLQRVIQIINNGHWHEAAAEPTLRPYYNVRSELCLNAENDIVLFDRPARDSATNCCQPRTPRTRRHRTH